MMQIFLYTLSFIIGLIFIIYGGNLLVKTALKISHITGIPEILIGATIVSLATTLPELTVTVLSSAGNLSDLAVGNAIGSVLFNLLFIIGICIFFSPQKVDKNNIKKNFYILFLTTLFLLILGIFNLHSFLTGIVLILTFIIFFIINIISANKKILIEGLEIHKTPVIKNPQKELFFVSLAFIIGATIITFGAKLLVTHGENIAHILNISEHIIGVTIVAIGTSLPELVTAINSIKLKSTNIAIGNTFGANILSTTLLIGTTSLMSGNLSIDKNITFIALPLILISLLLIYIPISKHGKTVKSQGLLLLIMFLIYYSSLFF